MLRKKCNRPMLLIKRQRAMLLEVYKFLNELGPRYRHGMFSQKSRAYDYRDPSILTLPKYNIYAPYYIQTAYQIYKPFACL